MEKEELNRVFYCLRKEKIKGEDDGHDVDGVWGGDGGTIWTLFKY